MRSWAESVAIHVLLFALLIGALTRGPALDTSTRRSAIAGVSLQGRGAPTAKERTRVAQSVRSTRFAQDMPAPVPVAGKSIAAIALAESANPSSGSSTDSPGGGAYDSYLGLVREQIDRSIIYPMTFRARRITGLVMIHLDLDPRGAIRATEVAETSGSAELDRFIMDAVRAAGPFPPYTGKGRVLSFNLPIELKMR